MTTMLPFSWLVFGTVRGSGSGNADRSAPAGGAGGAGPFAAELAFARQGSSGRVPSDGAAAWLFSGGARGAAPLETGVDRGTGSREGGFEEPPSGIPKKIARRVAPPPVRSETPVPAPGDGGTEDAAEPTIRTVAVKAVPRLTEDVRVQTVFADGVSAGEGDVGRWLSAGSRGEGGAVASTGVRREPPPLTAGERLGRYLRVMTGAAAREVPATEVERGSKRPEPRQDSPLKTPKNGSDAPRADESGARSPERPSGDAARAESAAGKAAGRSASAQASAGDVGADRPPVARDQPLFSARPTFVAAKGETAPTGPSAGGAPLAGSTTAKVQSEARPHQTARGAMQRAVHGGGGPAPGGPTATGSARIGASTASAGDAPGKATGHDSGKVVDLNGPRTQAVPRPAAPARSKPETSPNAKAAGATDQRGDGSPSKSSGAQAESAPRSSGQGNAPRPTVMEAKPLFTSSAKAAEGARAGLEPQTPSGESQGSRPSAGAARSAASSGAARGGEAPASVRPEPASPQDRAREVTGPRQNAREVTGPRQNAREVTGPVQNAREVTETVRGDRQAGGKRTTGGADTAPSRELRQPAPDPVRTESEPLRGDRGRIQARGREAPVTRVRDISTPAPPEGPGPKAGKAGQDSSAKAASESARSAPRGTEATVKHAAAEAAARASRFVASHGPAPSREPSVTPSQDTSGQGSQAGSSGSDGSASSDRQEGRSQATRTPTEAPTPARTSSGFGQVLDERVGSTKASSGRPESGGSSILPGASGGEDAGSGSGKATSIGGGGAATAPAAAGSASAAATPGPQAFAPASSASSAPAAPPAGTAHAGSAPAAAAVEQMVARLSALDQGRSAVVGLEPPELGRVLVRFMRRGKGWKVQLIADRPEVAQALNRDIGRLSQALGRDSNVVDVEVSSDPGEDRSGGSWTSDDGEQSAFAQGFAPLASEAPSQPASLSAIPSAEAGLSSLDVTG